MQAEKYEKLKIQFNSDDDLSSKKKIEFYHTIIVVRPVFKDGNHNIQKFSWRLYKLGG